MFKGKGWHLVTIHIMFILASRVANYDSVLNFVMGTRLQFVYGVVWVLTAIMVCQGFNNYGKEYLNKKIKQEIAEEKGQE